MGGMYPLTQLRPLFAVAHPLGAKGTPKKRVSSREKRLTVSSPVAQPKDLRSFLAIVFAADLPFLLSSPRRSAVAVVLSFAKPETQPRHSFILSRNHERSHPPTPNLRRACPRPSLRHPRQRGSHRRHYVEAVRLHWLGHKQGRLKLISEAWLKSAPPEGVHVLAIILSALERCDTLNRKKE
jgi:hypothetical protein